MALQMTKRKRSFDAVSDSGTCATEQTEASTGRDSTQLDERSASLTARRREYAEAKLQLEDRIKQAQDQLQHTQTQLLELKGCDGIDDLQAQLQVYQREETDAVAQLSKLQERFEADVAASLGINPEQQHAQLEAELQHQAALQQAQVQTLVVEQQLAQPCFAVTDSSKRAAKRARMERSMNQVWDWLQQGSGAPPPQEQQQPQQQQLEQQQQQQQLEQQPSPHLPSPGVGCSDVPHGAAPAMASVLEQPTQQCMAAATGAG